VRALSGNSTLEAVEDVERMIDAEFDAEFEEKPEWEFFYKGVYFGDLDRVHLLRLATLLAHWNLSKETKNE